jgi:CBS domain containing-hemolysin-like protein
MLMLVLLGCSGFCSAAETAFFHLSPRKAAGFANSTRHYEQLIYQLLQNPNRLLTSLLLCNMMVNVLFFSLAGVIAIRINSAGHSIAASLWAGAAFFILLVFGEMLPKALAYNNTYTICRFAAYPSYLSLKILTPILAIINLLFVKPTVRLAAPAHEMSENKQPISLKQLRLLLDQSAKKGQISEDENMLLLEMLELRQLKVRNVMRPRVEMPCCSMDSNPAEVQTQLLEYATRQIPVYAGAIDSIVGMIYLRDLLANPGVELKTLVKPVHFVPEQKNVESLIAFFQMHDIDIAVAVDEYGGIAGLVKLDDIIDQLLGANAASEMDNPIQQVGPMAYRLSARLSIHDWAETFGVDPEQIRLTTIGGLVTALLGHIPKNGDMVRWQNMTFTVEHVQQNRIETLILTLEPMAPKND